MEIKMEIVLKYIICYEILKFDENLIIKLRIWYDLNFKSYIFLNFNSVLEFKIAIILKFSYFFFIKFRNFVKHASACENHLT